VCVCYRLRFIIYIFRIFDLTRTPHFHREPQPSSILEQELGEVLEDDGDSEWVDDVDDPTGWDKLFIDVESDSED
jgi:hypothetical protein